MFSGLSLDQAPPFEAPLRFFLTAPIFAILAAILIFFSQDFSNFYSPSSIAIIHLFTIGFMSMVMIGAIQQMLPVLVGVRFPKPLLFSKIIHLCLIIGTLLFVFSFYLFKNYLFIASTLFLATGIGIFTALTLYKLFIASFASETVTGMRLSLISLFITLSLGSYLLISLSIGKVDQNFNLLLLAHIIFAIFGWTGLLIIGVSYQVIPMFYVTPQFNKNIKKYLTFAIFIFLFMTTFLLFFDFKIALILLLTLYAFFGIATLNIYKKRKRKIADITVNFWILSSYSLIIGTLLAIVYLFFQFDKLLWISGVLIIYGFTISLINGMLYKIIPFLAWFHLSSRGFFDIPTTKEMIKQKDANIQLIFHILALISILILIFFPFEKIASLLIIISNSLLLRNILKATKIYFKYKNRPSPFENMKIN